MRGNVDRHHRALAEAAENETVGRDTEVAQERRQAAAGFEIIGSKRVLVAELAGRGWIVRVGDPWEADKRERDEKGNEDVSAENGSHMIVFKHRAYVLVRSAVV